MWQNWTSMQVVGTELVLYMISSPQACTTIYT